MSKSNVRKKKDIDHDIYLNFSSNYLDGFKKCDRNSDFELDNVELSICLKNPSIK